MRQVFGTSRFQNQQFNPSQSGAKLDSNMKLHSNYKNVEQYTLTKINEERPQTHQTFGHRYQQQDFEFLNLYESTKQLVSIQIQYCEPHELAADLILRYNLVEDSTLIEEQKIEESKVVQFNNLCQIPSVMKMEFDQ
ncbi:unnamed protein product [Paramecium primaurelia]|uniref:Uncharacterized protein n=1 Tax=Paramecium primaurelia TaxID=5886 RepID=A0A8S1MUT2_PARPR|nr:unnamed protein product [Paramecium primaurelia]